jgi:hypothetical protein
MTKETRNKIIHSILFNVFWGAVIYVQVSSLAYPTILLAASALCFVGIHFCFFAKDFVKELIFLAVGFSAGFVVEGILSNSGVYHYGIVDTPGLSWPPPWMAAMWLMFPPLITYTLGFLKDYPVAGSAFVAASTFGTYYLFGKKMDLIFFNPPLWQGFVAFFLFWFLLLRFLVRVQKKLVL